MTLKTKKQNYHILTICTISVLLVTATPNIASAFVQSVNGQAGAGGDREVVNGMIKVPSPTASGPWHKDYMMYVTDPFTEFTAGSGIYIQKDSDGTVTKCHLMLYANDGPSPPTNFHFVDCSPGPSTSDVSAGVFQVTDDDTEWTGQSAGNQKTYDFVNSADDPNLGGLQGSKNPSYWGYAAGSSVDDDDLFSHAYDLETRQWGGSSESFTASGAFDKCYIDTGYRLEFVSNEDEVKTGPPTATNECTNSLRDYAPYGGEWR